MPRAATGHVRQKANGSWEIVVRARDPKSGRTRPVSRSLPAPATRQDALDLRDQLLAQAETDKLSAARGTVGGLLTEWFHAFSYEWSPKTVVEHRRIVFRQLIPRIGSKQLRRLRTPDVDKLYAELRARGGKVVEGKARPLSPATVTRSHHVLHSALAQAVTWGLITRNPATGASPGEVEEDEVEPPAPEDVVRLIDEATKLEWWWGLFVHLAAVLGARRGEMCGLKWSAIDLEAGVVVIRRVVVIGEDGPVLRETTKTKRRRKVAIDEETARMLQRHRLDKRKAALELGHRFSDDAYVFSYAPDCSAPLRPDSVTRRFGRLRKRVGLGDVRLQDLRHAVVTDALTMADVRTVQRHVGHSSLAMTQRYGHQVDAEERRLAEALAERLRSARKTG